MRQLFHSLPAIRPILLSLLGSVLVLLTMHAIPTRHIVDIGGPDSAYLQGFYDQQPIPALFARPGTGRWSGPEAALRLPLIGMPAQLSITAAAPLPRTLTILTDDPSAPDSIAVPLDTHWQTIPIPIPGVLQKLWDTPVLLRSDTSPWQKGDLRSVGIMLDSLTYETNWGALPYPSTAVATLFTTLLLALAFSGRAPTVRRRDWMLAGCLPHLVVAFAWRWPLHSAFVVPAAHWWGLAAALAYTLLVYWRVVVSVWQRWQAVAGAVLISGWSAWYVVLQQSHLTLVVPGVEKDFRSFATRASDLDGVLRADGFYQIGYPALLWLGQALSGQSAYAVGLTLSVAAAAVLLLGVWWVARLTLGRGWDVVCVTIVMASAFFGDAALLLGTDIPFAAAATLGIGALLWAQQRPDALQRWWLAGALLALAFLIRHTGLVLGIVAVLALLTAPASRTTRLRAAAWFVPGWGVMALPQLWVNLRNTGTLFYNTQAKNSWLAVYGGMDWGRWGDVPDDISLMTIVLNDPGRFLASWWRNISVILGTGATEQQYDAALWQRLLSVPFNWIAAIGVVWAGYRLVQRTLDPARQLLYGWAVAFCMVSALAFVLPRLLLPLLVVAAIAATDGVRLVVRRCAPQYLLIVAALVSLVLAQTVQQSHQRLLAGQPADERDALAFVQTLAPERLAVLVPAESPAGKYSVLSAVTVLRTTTYPVPKAIVCDAQPDVLLWSNELVPPHPELIPQAHIGRYWVFRMQDNPSYCTTR